MDLFKVIFVEFLEDELKENDIEDVNVLKNQMENKMVLFLRSCDDDQIGNNIVLDCLSFLDYIEMF